MTNTKNHGGKREGAGRTKKPAGESKIYIVVGIPENDVKAYGGPDKLKADVKLMVETKLK